MRPAGLRRYAFLLSLLLGGGADGIHKPVKAFTDYMELISTNAKKKAE